MPKKTNRVNKKFLIIVGNLILLSVLGLSFLLAGSKALELAEVKLDSANQFTEKSILVSEAAGAEKKQIVSKNITPPLFSSQAVYAQDLETGQILYEKNIHQRLSPASTTKIMTALIAEEHYPNSSILTVTPESLVSGSTMGVKLGEQLTFRSLLYGMLLNSGNDASYTIASNYPGGVLGFVQKMNEKVQALGLTDTHFDNPAGFDSYNHYSSAYDLAKIAEEAIKNDQIRRIVATKETEIVSWDKTKEHNLRNLNKLLAEEGVIGIKTGTTELAGENFVGLVERNGHKVITVVLRSDDRFGETKKLMDWVYQNYEWE